MQPKKKSIQQLVGEEVNRRLGLDSGDTVADLVGQSDSARPSKVTFNDLCEKSQADRSAARAELAAAAVKENPRNYRDMDRVKKLADEFGISTIVAGRILHPER